MISCDFCKKHIPGHSGGAYESFSLFSIRNKFKVKFEVVSSRVYKNGTEMPMHLCKKCSKEALKAAAKKL